MRWEDTLASQARAASLAIARVNYVGLRKDRPFEKFLQSRIAADRLAYSRIGHVRGFALTDGPKPAGQRTVGAAPVATAFAPDEIAPPEGQGRRRREDRLG